MRSKVTFIHAADLHLGAPFRGLRALDSAWADVLVRAIPEAFRAVVDAACAREVDFVLLAGDSFDSSSPSYADYALFIRGLEKLGEHHIPVYMITGNHDPYASWQQVFGSLPKNVTLLGVHKPEFACYRREGEPLVLIGARGYYNQAWPTGEYIAEGISRKQAEAALGCTAPFMVGLLHTGLDIDSTRSPARPKRLLAEDVDYWACGHVHQPRVLPDESHPRIVFSGSPQGRDAKEVGSHGAYLVTLEEGEENAVEFIPAAKVEWQRLYLDISSCQTVSEVQELVTNAEFSCNSKSHCQRMVFRVKLLGRTPLYRSLNPVVLEEVRRALNERYPFFFVDDIVNATSLPIDRESIRRDGMFPSVFLNAINQKEANREETLRAVEAAFHQQGITPLTSFEREFDSLSASAENLVLGLIGQDVAP